MARTVAQRSQEGIGLIETVIATLLLGITVSGSIFIAAELSRSGADARVRAGALDVSSSRIEAALYEGAGFGDLSSYNTTQGAVSNASYGIETTSNGISSIADWSFRDGDEQVALNNTHFYDSEFIGNIAQGGSGDPVESSGEGDGSDGGDGTDGGDGSDGSDGSDESDGEDGSDESDDSDDSDGNTNWTATILVNVDQGSSLDQSLDASLTPNSGYDSGTCGEAGGNDSFVCSINVLTTTTWAGLLSIEVVGGGGGNPDVICNGVTGGGDDPATFVIGLTQANPSATVTIRQEEKASKCDDDEGPVVSDAAITVSTSVTNGSASPSQQLAFLGQTASIEFSPDTGYQIATDGISGCNGTDASTSPYSTGSLTEDCSVTAAMTAIEYLVSATDGTNGTVSPGSQTVAYGGGTSFLVTPESSHTLAGVSASSSCSASVSGNDLVVSSVTGACTVTPTYTVKSYTMSATAGAGIEAVDPSSQSVTHGDTGQVSVTLATGYEGPVADGCGDGAVSNGQFESAALTDDCEVTFSAFGEVNVVSWSASGSSGVETPSGLPIDVTYPNSYTVPSISASEGYGNVTIYSDCENDSGSEVISGAELAISSDCEIYATAEQGAAEWTASITVVVNENANKNRDEWSISVPGCSPSSASFNQGGNAITFACTKTTTAASETFAVTVNGLNSKSGICTGNNQFDQSGWSASVTLTPSQNTYLANLVLDDKEDDCQSNQEPQTEYGP